MIKSCTQNLANGQAPKAAKGHAQAHAPITRAPLSSLVVEGKFGLVARKLLVGSGMDASQ
jgi:hypothetical protein